MSNAEPLHLAKDNLGIQISKDGVDEVPVDFVSTGNNHHVAIYEDKDGKLYEKVVSFFEVVARVNEGLPVIDKGYNSQVGWRLKFTMKQNEMFVFPSEDFNPNEIDMFDKSKASEISPNLFRVQKLTNKDYVFRHHLETTVTNDLKFTFKRLQAPSHLRDLIKVRLNHLGEIVHVGEY